MIALCDMLGLRIFLITDLGEIELTGDEHILRNLNWCNPRIKIAYR